MKKHIYDENNGLSYTLYGDYYIPDIVLPEDEIASYGKYGLLKKQYLKEYRKGLYNSLLLKGQLNVYLNQFDQDMREQVDELVNRMAKKERITKQLKEDNPIEWVRRMNVIKMIAEEIVGLYS